MLSKIKNYYIAYDILVNQEKIIHGSGTFQSKGKPDIEKWLEDIKDYNNSKSQEISLIQVLSCIEVDKDFMK